MSEGVKKTLGQAIDEVVAALKPLDEFGRVTAVRAACEHLGIAVPVVRGTDFTPGIEPPETAGSTIPASHQPLVIDIRTLKDIKRPTTAIEMACLVAYYLDSAAPLSERKKDVSSADMEKYFKQAGYRLPSRMTQLLVDARTAGYFDSAGHGKYRLNPVGHNLVVHNLPKTKK